MIRFTIIIPVKEVNDYVRETVLYIQTIRRTDWEVIILPNRSSEIDEWFDERIRIIPSGLVGPGQKRDIGAHFASGDILVFLDDDSYPSPDLLNVAQRYFVDSEVAALGGPGITPPSDSFWQHVSGAVFLSHFTGGAPERYVPLGNVREVDDWPSVNLMVRKDAFFAVGGFDSRYWPGEDTKLCLKLKRTGKRILYAPDMIVWHHRRTGLRSHAKQVGAYGLHRGYFARHHPETSLRLKYFMPSLFSVFVLFSAFMPLMPQALTPLVILGWALYCMALLVGAFQMIRFESLPAVVAATLIYVPVTHFYYGLKFMSGYFQRKELVSSLR